MNDDVLPCGPILGWFRGLSDRMRPVWSWVVRDGRRYAFDHVVLWQPGLRVALAPGQILVEPGIVYRRVWY